MDPSQRESSVGVLCIVGGWKATTVEAEEVWVETSKEGGREGGGVFVDEGRM